jgi:hypothetical protein
MTTRQDVAGAPSTAITMPGRVALLSFTQAPPDRVKEYVGFLLSRGVPVSVVCLSAGGWREFRGVGHLDVVPLRQAERQHLVNVLESVIVYDVAGAAIHRARRLARRAPVLRPPVTVIYRTHRKVARAFHTKVYNRFYALVRAQVLASLGRRELRRNGPIPPLARIVAADTHAIALGWRLAKQFPQAVATTALERQPYADLPVIPGVPEPILRQLADDE